MGRLKPAPTSVVGAGFASLRQSYVGAGFSQPASVVLGLASAGPRQSCVGAGFSGPVVVGRSRLSASQCVSRT